MASIKDVAKLAGVSVMTASRVMNNVGSVSAQAKAQVLRAAKELEYRPNLTARSLRVHRSHLLGLLLPDIENPVFAALAKHVEEAANRYGYSVMLGNTWEDAAREAKYLEIMMSRQMDGLLVSPVSIGNNESIRQFSSPVVMLDRSFNHVCPPPSVTVDNYEVGRLAARHLVSLGHKNFACIPGPLHIDVFAERLEGYREELARSGKVLEAVISAGNIEKMGYGADFFTELLRIFPARPMALFCANDLTALGAMQAARRHDISIPGELSVVGVDDIPAGSLTAPTLTTVRQPVREIADAGVGMLVEMIRSRDFSPENIALKPSLVIRDSTGPYRTHSAIAKRPGLSR